MISTFTSKPQKLQWLLSIVFLLVLQQASAQQQITVSGTVTDERGQPLPGVSVRVKNSTAGVASDINGRYTINSSDSRSSLIFSFVGYTTAEVRIADRIRVDISLQPQPKSLNEVVVIGYGSQKRETVTGSIATVKAEDFNKGVVFDPLTLIQGKVSGLAISHPNGSDPNQVGEIQLRGPNSIEAQPNPLVVIDGIPNGDLSTIAPSDIASIDILRDGSAAAIYGSRATGGVIIVTTKRGQNGPARVTYSGYMATDQITKHYDVLSAPQYLSLAKALGDSNVVDKGANTNWFNALTHKPFNYGHNINVSGGTDKTTYSASFNYQKYQGIDIKTQRQFINGAFRLNTKAINDKLDIAVAITNSFDNKNYANYYGFGQALNINPTYPIYNPDGTFFETPQINGQYNPVADTKYNTNKNTEKRLLGNVRLTYSILPTLKAAVSYSYTRRDILTGAYTNNMLAYQQTSGLDGQASRTEEDYTENTIEATLQYSKSFGKHSIDILAGHSYVNDFDENFGAGNNNFNTNAYLYYNLGAGSALNDLTPGDNRGGVFVSSGAYEETLLSYFGRVIYNYDEKYILNASLRREGSSKLGANNKWQNFPGVSVGWLINKEEFMKDVQVVKNLKLRGGYGLTGNQGAFQPYLSLATYGPYPYGYNTGYVGNGNNGSYILAYGPTINNNPNLRWETKREFDLGLDFSLFNSQWLSGSVDFYDRRVNNLLGNYYAQVPSSIYPLVLANAGNLTNRGVELTVNTRFFKTTDFTWSATLVSSYNQNKVNSISSDQFAGTAHDITDIGVGTIQRMAAGYSTSEFYGRVFRGINAQGDWLFENNEGQAVDYKDIGDDYKLAYLGNSVPKVNLGLTNNFHYKSFDLSVLLRSSLGFYAVNAKRLFHENLSQFGNNNLFASALNTNLNADPIFSSYYLEKGDFLKLDNVTLSYTVPLKKNTTIQRLRFSVTGTNLATITKFSGMDPELGLNPFSSTGVEYNYNYYPRTRSFTFAVSAEF